MSALLLRLATKLWARPELYPPHEAISAIVQGEAARILPHHATGAKLPKLIKNSQLVVIPDGPHAIIWTHADQVNPVLLDFLKEN
jgi:non-heme chloroperoxidase